MAGVTWTTNLGGDACAAAEGQDVWIPATPAYLLGKGREGNYYQGPDHILSLRDGWIR